MHRLLGKSQNSEFTCIKDQLAECILFSNISEKLFTKPYMFVKNKLFGKNVLCQTTLLIYLVFSTLGAFKPFLSAKTCPKK